MHVARPFRACGDIVNSRELFGKIAVVQRGDCMFVEKVKLME